MAETKKYCCSNRSSMEAVNVGSLDLIISLISFITALVFTYFYNFKMENLKDAPRRLGTVKKFMTLQSQTQNEIVIGLITITTIKIFQSSFLLLGSIYQNSLLLKLWLVSSIPIAVAASVTAFILAYFAKEKLLIGCLAMFYLMLQIYTVWIIKEYTLELRSVSTESQLHLDEQKSPTMELNSTIH